MDAETLKRALVRLGIPIDQIRESQDNGSVSCPCPLARWTHEFGVDNHPSFWAVGGSSPNYRCFACGNKGTMRSLIKRYSTLSKVYIDYGDFGGRYDYLLPTVDTRIRHETEMKLPDNLLDNFQPYTDFEEAEKYLLDVRGLQREVVDRYNILYDPDKDMVVFPVYGTHGRLVGAVGRALTGKAFHNYYHAKLGATVGGIHKVPDDVGVIVLCEGWIDLLSAVPWAEKHNAGVVCTWTAGLSAGQAAILSSWSSLIMCAFDRDTAGNKGWNNVVTYFGSVSGSRIRRFNFPEGRDMNDLIEEDFDAAYQTALLTPCPF